MYTYSNRWISSCDCKNVCTRYNARTNALHLRLDIVYDFEPSNWIVVVGCIFLTLNGGGIIKQDWCITALQLIQRLNNFLQQEQMELEAWELMNTWTKQSWKWRRIRDAAILRSRDTAVLMVVRMVLSAFGQVLS